MQKCKVCGNSDFYKESGYFFCQTCQTQNEDIREEIFEVRVDSTTRLRKTRIRTLRSDKTGEELGWTSWELYNFVLIGITNELIELGVPSDIKLTILQLWATYLGKLEVAFTSRNTKAVPKLARRYNRKDAEIIYGKVQLQKRIRKRKRTSTNASTISGFQSEGGSSGVRELNKSKKLLAAADYDRYLQSQASSEGDGLSLYSQSAYSMQSSSIKSSGNEGRVQFSYHAKEEANKVKKLAKNVARNRRAKYKAKHISSQYRGGPYIITPMRLWAIVYLALRLHNQPIQLGDMLRYGREGHLSYYKLDHLLPPDVALTKSEANFLSQTSEITHKGMRRIIASMAKFLKVWHIVSPDFSALVSRYCQELGLPRGIQLYTERLIALSPPKMTFDSKKPFIPNYEGRAIAFIIVVLKTLIALDDITEYQISRIAEKINSVAIEKGLLSEKLFSFQEWQQYIECRKTILTHSHYPTKMKYSPDTHGIDDLYIKFLEFVISKADRKQLDTKSSKHFVPEELVDAMTKYIVNLSVNDLPAKAIDIFPASLTPLYSYLQQLLDHPLYDIPSIARNDFFLTKVGYMTKPDSLIELATQCGIELEVINSSLHFLEKVVLPFEQPKMPTVEELKQLVDIQDDLKGQSVERSEHFNDYIHRKMPCEMKLNRFKEQYYDSIRNSANCESTELGNVFTFTEILPNGRLAIPTDNDSETEEKDTDCNDSVNKENRLLDNKFCNKYNLCLSLPEKESISKSNLIKQLYSKKRKLQCTSNDKGQFIKKKPLSVKIEKNNYDTFSETKDLSFYTSSQENLLEETNIAQKFTEESFLNNVIDVNIDINKTDIETEFSDLENFINSSGISLFGEDKRISMTDKSKKITTDGKYTFFRPFKEYWMYHCNFSRVKSKNFALFEKTLPRSFRWLLNECALMGEMSTEDLYEEVCLIEAFHAYIFKSSDTNNDNGKSISTNQMNLILNKW